MSQRADKVNQARIPENITITRKQIRNVVFLILNGAALLANGSYSASSLMESRKGSKAVTIEQLDERTSRLEKQAEDANKKLDVHDDKLDRILKLLLPRRQSDRK